MMLMIISAFLMDRGLIIECIVLVLQAFTKMVRTGTEVYWVSAHGTLSQA